MDPPLDAMGKAVTELADSAEASKGEMLPPSIDLSSFANQELKQDDQWGDPTTVATPMYETLAHLELLFHAACDHMRSLGKLLHSDPVSWFGHIAVARSVAETSSRMWWLADDGIGALDRVGRHLAERLAECNVRQRHLDGAWGSFPPALHTAAQAEVDAAKHIINTWAQQNGLPTSQAGNLNLSRPGSTKLLALLYEADQSSTATNGQAGALATFHYHQQSAVAHGGPSGVALYHQQGGAGGHAHNILTYEQVGHSVLPALTAFTAGFDRISRYFRWERPDFDPMAWNTIHEVNKLLQSATP